MNKVFLPSLLLTLACIACAPAQTSGGSSSSSTANTLLRAGQTWQVEAQAPDGQPDRFTVTLSESGVTRNPSGFVGFFDTAQGSGLAFSPRDARGPEFLAARRMARPTSACIVLNPSATPSTTTFQGRYALSDPAAQAYVEQNRTEGLGTCTLTRTTPQ